MSLKEKWCFSLSDIAGVRKANTIEESLLQSEELNAQSLSTWETSKQLWTCKDKN